MQKYRLQAIPKPIYMKDLEIEAATDVEAIKEAKTFNPQVYAVFLYNNKGELVYPKMKEE